MLSVFTQAFFPIYPCVADRGGSHECARGQYNIWQQGVSQQRSEHSKPQPRSQSGPQPGKDIEDGVGRGRQKDAALISVWTLTGASPLKNVQGEKNGRKILFTSKPKRDVKQIGSTEPRGARFEALA